MVCGQLGGSGRRREIHQGHDCSERRYEEGRGGETEMRIDVLRLEEERRAQDESHRLFLEGTKQIAQRDREQCLKEGAGCP